MKSFGGAPFLDSSWDEKNFNIKKLFEKESFNAVYFFLNHWIGLCPHPKKKSQEIVCLRNSTLIRIHGTRIDDIIHMYKELKINKQLIQSMYHKGIDYTISQVGKRFQFNNLKNINYLFFRKIYQKSM